MSEFANMLLGIFGGGIDRLDERARLDVAVGGKIKITPPQDLRRGVPVVPGGGLEPPRPLIGH